MNAPSKTSIVVNLSLSEIAALTWRASRGAGFHWGEADEAVFAATWLSRAGFEWVDILLGILKDTGTCRPIVKAGHWSGQTALCPLRTGIALCDFATLPQSFAAGKLVLEKVGNVGFLLPFVARAGEGLNRPLSMLAGDIRASLFPGRPPSIEQQGTGNSHFSCGVVQAVIAFSDIGDDAVQREWPEHHHGSITHQQYQELSAFALQMTVPTSAKSLAGAGAAGDDND